MTDNMFFSHSVRCTAQGLKSALNAVIFPRTIFLAHGDPFVPSLKRLNTLHSLMGGLRLGLNCGMYRSNCPSCCEQRSARKTRLVRPVVGSTSEHAPGGFGVCEDRSQCLFRHKNATFSPGSAQSSNQSQGPHFLSSEGSTSLHTAVFFGDHALEGRSGRCGSIGSEPEESRSALCPPLDSLRHRIPIMHRGLSSDRNILGLDRTRTGLSQGHGLTITTSAPLRHRTHPSQCHGG